MRYEYDVADGDPPDVVLAERVEHVAVELMQIRLVLDESEP